MAKLMVLMILVAVGCGSTPMAPDSEWLGVSAVPGEAEQPAPKPDPAPPVIKRGLWIVGLPVPETIAACRFWSEFGLTCVEAVDEAHAYITLVAEMNPDCTPTPEGIVWFGSANPGAVWMHLSCFLGGIGSDEGLASLYEATAAHEIGHAMGLAHVAPCTSDDTRAVMVPIGPHRGQITDVDRMEFLRVWGTQSPP